MNAAAPRAHRWWPGSMAARLYLVLLGGMLAAHALSFALLFYERYESATSMLMSNVEQDVVIAVKLLDRLPAAERERWVPMLRRRTFAYRLGPGGDGPPPDSAFAVDLLRRLEIGLDDAYAMRATQVSRTPDRFEVHLTLSDGRPLTVDVAPSVMPLARWLPLVLAAQVALLLLCTWAAVRLATRPLQRLAQAAERLDPAGQGDALPETGPTEVAQAAVAFNAMQRRIAGHTEERLQILAAIAHDLQTPITRMTLRVDAMDASPARDRLADDLRTMQQLVREGLTYARSAHAATEPPVRVDIAAFVDTLVCDYVDDGRAVALHGALDGAVVTRPHALRRVLCNLVENALNYAGAAEVGVDAPDADTVAIAVRDRGPGIPEAELARVMQPFYRLEPSRNRDTGGTGLGLAIAQQLATSIGATLTLANRDGGGLEARLVLARRIPAAG